MAAEAQPLGTWDPISPAAATEMFEGAPFRWWICGGIALELYVGDGWRAHDDLDIGVLRADTSDVHAWLSPHWELWVAARGELTPWGGKPLSRDLNENNVWARSGPESPWRFDIAVGAGDDTEWVYRRDETIRRPWEEATLHTSDGIPYLAPELQLLFKSKAPRPKDDVDAQNTIPSMEPRRRWFLEAALGKDHRWARLFEAH